MEGMITEGSTRDVSDPRRQYPRRNRTTHLTDSEFSGWTRKVRDDVLTLRLDEALTLRLIPKGEGVVP